MTEIPASASEIGPIGWRNWRAQATSAPGCGESVEFAIYSDAHLTEGNFELGPYTIINAVGSSGPIGNVQLGLVLRVADYLPDERPDYDWSRTDTTHYHGGGIAEEFAALLALSLGRRFRAGGSIREFDGEDDRFGRIWTDGFDRPFLAAPRGLPFRPGGIPMLPGIADKVRLGTALPFLEIYPTLELDAAVPLLRAARRFEEALWIADGDPQTRRTNGRNTGDWTGARCVITSVRSTRHDRARSIPGFLCRYRWSTIRAASARTMCRPSARVRLPPHKAACGVPKTPQCIFTSSPTSSATRYANGGWRSASSEPPAIGRAETELRSSPPPPFRPREAPSATCPCESVLDDAPLGSRRRPSRASPRGLPPAQPLRFDS